MDGSGQVRRDPRTRDRTKQECRQQLKINRAQEKMTRPGDKPQDGSMRDIRAHQCGNRSAIEEKQQRHDDAAGAH